MSTKPLHWSGSEHLDVLHDQAARILASGKQPCSVCMEPMEQGGECQACEEESELYRGTRWK